MVRSTSSTLANSILLVIIGIAAPALANDPLQQAVTEKNNHDTLILRGTVLDAETGKPIAAATISWGDLFAEAEEREQVETKQFYPDPDVSNCRLLFVFYAADRRTTLAAERSIALLATMGQVTTNST